MAMSGRGDPIVTDSWASACKERRLSSAIVAEQCNVAQQSHMHQCPISLRPYAQVPVMRKLLQQRHLSGKSWPWKVQPVSCCLMSCHQACKARPAAVLDISLQ